MKKNQAGPARSGEREQFWRGLVTAQARAVCRSANGAGGEGFRNRRFIAGGVSWPGEMPRARSPTPAGGTGSRTGRWRRGLGV